ncbi:MAG: M23 family metallopeptidase [Chitinispirillaceae bacterium]|nr:M23 family metallopeptidase [Chitinispirillaceae bacterium]
MFVPEDNGKTFTLRIPKYVFHSVLIFLVIFFSGIVLLLYKSGEIAAKLQVLSLIRLENEKLSKENDELHRITEKINRLDRLSKYLNRLSSTPVSAAEGHKTAPPISSLINEKVTSIKPQIVQHSSTSEKVGSLPNILPVEGWITRQFCPDSTALNGGHQGVDFAAALGTPIKSTAPGVVGKIENDKYFGLIITIFHENGFVTRYGHCSQILVSKHDRVNRGQTIALVGNTGRSTAPHLHYEVIKDGKNIDPAKHVLVHND